MRNMRARNGKMVLLAALVLLAGMLLSACHGTVDKDAAGKSALSTVPLYLDETKKIELNFWAKNDSNKVQTAAVYTKAIEGL